MAEKIDQIFLDEQERLKRLPFAALLAIDRGQITISFLKRYFQVGYATAGRLMDMMEDRKIVSKSVYHEPHEALIGWTEFETMFGPKDAYYCWDNCIKENTEQDGKTRV